MIELVELTARARQEGVPRAAFLGSEVALVRAIQTARGEHACFRSEHRLTCTNERCEWRRECRRLVAEWMR